MYTYMYYDGFKHKIYHRYLDEDNKRCKEVVSPEIEYYIKDDSGKSDIKDIYGKSVVRRVSKNRAGVKSVQESGFDCYESDISEEIKFLNRKYSKEKLSIDADNYNICVIDIEVESPNEFPKPEETKFPINLISVWFSKTNELYTFGNREYTGELGKNYHYCADEKTMMERFVWFFRKQNVDIITGWYSDSFDIPYIINRCKVLGVDYTKLSPFNKIKEVYNSVEYNIIGINQLDYINLYKKFTREKLESYSLNSVSLHEIKEGKFDFEGTINNGWEKDWNAFVDYNIQDVLLVKKLDDKLRYIVLAITISYDALISFGDVFSTLPMHTGYIYKYLKQKNIVMPIRAISHDESYPGAYVLANKGKYKYLVSYDVESEYPNMIMQYNIGPETLIKDPKNTEGLIKTPLSEYKTWKTAQGDKYVGGIYYDKSKKSILAQIVEKIFGERISLKLKRDICKFRNKIDTDEILKKLNIDLEYFNTLEKEIIAENGNENYYEINQYVRKIQINSLYGALGTKYFHFYNVTNATAITLSGQSLILYLSNNINDYLKNYFYKNKTYFPIEDEKNKLKDDVVVLIDTDSNYLCLDELIQKLGLEFKDNSEFLKWMNVFCDNILDPFVKKILKINANKYNVKDIINFKREKIADRMIISAKKRYVINTLENEGYVYDEPKLSVTGIEIVRTDTPSFCREYLKDVVSDIVNLDDKSKIEDLMKEIKKEFKTQLIEHIASPKGISDYQKYDKMSNVTDGISYPKSCPIHVKAAINYNYVINKYNLKLQAINNGTKMKFIYVKTSNLLNTYVIGWIGKYPEKFKELFTIDYELQWKKSFQNIIQRLFDVVGWEEVSLNNNFSKFFD